jgi:hypothetical protein
MVRKKNLQNYTSGAVGAEIWIVYRLFDYEDDFKWKNFELQSCRSHRKLQFSYKVYFHSSLNKKYKFLKRDGTPTVVAHGGMRCYSTARLLPP